jgi:hypothetical protein
VIEVPVGVDQLLDGIRVDARQSRKNVRTRGHTFGVDDELPVRTAENGNISARTQKNVHIAPQGLNGDLCASRFL